MPRLLFVGENNAARSQMAEGFARALAPPGVEVASAGLAKGKIHPLAVRVMAEAGIDIASHASKTVADLGTQLFDVVVALSARAGENCPVLQGIPGAVHWNLADPARAKGGEEELLAAFRQSRDEIKRRVADLFAGGYFYALLTLKDNADRILDNLSEGIVAHDLYRRIFYFNSGAEKITGYRREEVLGRDCHEVFPGGFCGGKCSFAEKGVCRARSLNYTLDFTSREGERKYLEVSVVPIKDNAGEMVGILASYRDQTRLLELERRLGEIQQFAGIIGRDHKMLQIFELIRDVADSSAPVLIQGETGTGKELVAAAIHNESIRAGKPFVAVNCGALPQGTLESELFGHVKGAFTGAIRDKKGRFELADGGTIFLDEVGELPPATQVKLLRVLQEGTFERVGGERTVRVNVRVISATNRDLKEMIKQGKFREDLYYRLCVVPITLPPLRERRNDIPLLAQHFLQRLAAEAGREVFLSAEALEVLVGYAWPGNVRQLQNAIQFALIKCRGNSVKPEHLPPEIVRGAESPEEKPERQVKQEKPAGPAGKPGRKPKLDREKVQKALREAGGNKARAARLLGVGRATLYRFLS
ncbi:MAG: sigma 54-interacting transcriptional regulator [Bacillota bacterium]